MGATLSLNTRERDDGMFVLVAAGEIDLSNIDSFAEALSAAAGRGQGTVTVDLSGVDYLDSGGLSVLFAHADRIHVVANPVLMPVMKISGLSDVVSIESASPPASV
jgi:anti-anti-sigma factor